MIGSDRRSLLEGCALPTSSRPPLSRHIQEAATRTVSAHVFTLALLTEIMKSFLPSRPALAADSWRHSSSAPVCSRYARRFLLLFSPQHSVAVDSLLILLLFVCHRRQSGVCPVVIINSKQLWAPNFLSGASIGHRSSGPLTHVIVYEVDVLFSHEML